MKPLEIADGWKRIVRETANKMIALARLASERTGLSVEQCLDVFTSPQWMSNAIEGLPLDEWGGKTPDEWGGETPRDFVREVIELVNLERNVN